MDGVSNQNEFPGAKLESSDETAQNTAQGKAEHSSTAFLCRQNNQTARGLPGCHFPNYLYKAKFLINQSPPFVARQPK